MFSRPNRKDVLNHLTTSLAVVADGVAKIVGELYECAGGSGAGVDVNVGTQRCGWYQTREVVGEERDAGVSKGLRGCGAGYHGHVFECGDKAAVKNAEKRLRVGV